jgi:hypothetical protein
MRHTGETGGSGMTALGCRQRRNPAMSVVQPDATDRINVLLDSAGDPAAVNCRQPHAKRDRRTAFALVRGALGGTRTPNLLIRRCTRRIDNVEGPLFSGVSDCGRLLRAPFDGSGCRQLLPSPLWFDRSPSTRRRPLAFLRGVPFNRYGKFSPIGGCDTRLAKTCAWSARSTTGSQRGGCSVSVGRLTHLKDVALRAGQPEVRG